MKRWKENTVTAVLVAAYGLMGYRYFPGKPWSSLVETLLHFLSVAPFTVGATLLISAIIQKTSGEKIPWAVVLRIFLTVGIILEFFFGLSNYLQSGLDAQAISPPSG